MYLDVNLLIYTAKIWKVTTKFCGYFLYSESRKG